MYLGRHFNDFFDDFETKIVNDTLLDKSESIREIGFVLKGNIDTIISKIENRTLTNGELNKCIKLLEKHTDKFEKLMNSKYTFNEKIKDLNKKNKELKILLQQLYGKKLNKELNFEMIQDYYKLKIEGITEWFKNNFLFKCIPSYILNSIEVKVEVTLFGGSNYKQAFKELGGGWHYKTEQKSVFDERMKEFGIKFTEDYLLLATEENIKLFEDVVKKHIKGISRFSYNLIRKPNDIFAIDKFTIDFFNIDNILVSIEEIIDDKEDNYLIY